MSTLTVTSKGRFTLRKEFLRHLDVKSSDKIELDLLPNGRAQLKSEQLQG